MRNQKKKLKMSMPTARERERYIHFGIVSDDAVVYSDVEAAVWNTLLDFYGEYGVGGMSLWMVRGLWNDRGQNGVIRCNHMSVPKVIAGLGLVSRLGQQRIVVKIGKVSGTIKGLE